MNRIKSMAIVLAGGLVAAACASAPAPAPKVVTKAPPKPKTLSPAEQLGEANQKFSSGDYAAAIGGYDKVLAKDPKNPTVLYNRAVAQHRMGKLDEAAAGYEAALAVKPSDQQAALNLGAVLKARDQPGDVDKAISVYKKALAKDPFNPNLLNNLSVLYREKKKYAKAESTLRKLLMRDQKNIDAYKNLALIHYDQKQYKLTETILENALNMSAEQKRKDPDIYVNLGMVYLARDENGKAMAAFKKALEIDPNNLPANYNIGALALGHRDYGLAAKAYGIVAKSRPSDYYVAASLGYAHQGLQQLDEAQQWLEKARELKLHYATAGAAGAPVASQAEDEQMVLQLMIISQSKEDNSQALKYASEYMKKKQITCSEEDFDGFCGRVNGIKMMIQMAKEAAAAPPPEEEKPKAKGVDVFTDQPDEAEVPAEGEGAAEGGEGASPEAADGASADAGGEGGNP